MTVYEQLKRRLGSDGSASGPGLGPGLASAQGQGLGLSPSVAAGVAGALARFNAVTLIAPLELVKTLQVRWDMITDQCPFSTPLINTTTLINTPYLLFYRLLVVRKAYPLS